MALAAVKRAAGGVTLALPNLPLEQGNGVVLEQMCGDRRFMEHGISLAFDDSLLPLTNTLAHGVRRSQRILRFFIGDDPIFGDRNVAFTVMVLMLRFAGSSR